MTQENLEEMILYSMKFREYMATWVIRNCILSDFNKKIKTPKLRYKLKQMEEKGLIKLDESRTSKNNLVWTLKANT